MTEKLVKSLRKNALFLLGNSLMNFLSTFQTPKKMFPIFFSKTGLKQVLYLWRSVQPHTFLHCTDDQDANFLCDFHNVQRYSSPSFLMAKKTQEKKSFASHAICVLLSQGQKKMAENHPSSSVFCRLQKMMMIKGLSSALLIVYWYFFKFSGRPMDASTSYV